MERISAQGADRRAEAASTIGVAVLPGLPAIPREPEGRAPLLWGRLSLPLPRAGPGAPEHPFFPERKPFWATLAEARSGDLLERLDRRV